MSYVNRGQRFEVRNAVSTQSCRFLSTTEHLPVTTKAQQKAENADDADNAEGRNAIYRGFLRTP
jgi:hypothetical protein